MMEIKNMFQTIKGWFGRSTDSKPRPEPKYISERDLPDSADAMIESGSIEFWRQDTAGARWFRTSHPDGLAWHQAISSPDQTTKTAKVEAIDSQDPADDSEMDWDEFDRRFDAEKIWQNRQQNFPADEDGDSTND